jgi:hypothetical protein
MFHPHALSSPVIVAFESSPGVACAIALNVGDPGAMPARPAACSNAAE